MQRSWFGYLAAACFVIFLYGLVFGHGENDPRILAAYCMAGFSGLAFATAFTLADAYKPDPFVEASNKASQKE